MRLEDKKQRVLEKLEEHLGKGRIKINEPLSLHTTFKIGGPTDFYFEANSSEEIIKVVELLKKLKIPLFILGGGSNILVGDKGFRGLVIKNKSRNIKILGFHGQIKNHASKIKDILLEIDSGVPFNQLVRFSLEEGLEGFEEFLGLPGTVGGAIAVNAHWQERKVNDFVVSKKVFENIILSAIFQLKKGNREFLWEKAKKALEYRQKTQPLNYPSAGCIFKNIKKSEAARIGTPNFLTSAGFLIEAAGFKGRTIGKAQVSSLHANFIINLGGAKAKDVLELIELIKAGVFEKFRVVLKEEIIKVGEF